MKYAWIEGQLGRYPVEAMCQALAVSPSGWASWRRGGRTDQRLAEPVLLALIRAIHTESKGAYGWPRIWRELHDRGIPAGKERVRKLMQSNGIRARHKRCYKATTDSKHNLPGRAAASAAAGGE
ncbi:MAG: transposase [Gammaproteobacteria bacterium]|nr:transposase [Gammaproteobacteria bacterium]